MLTLKQQATISAFENVVTVIRALEKAIDLLEHSSFQKERKELQAIAERIAKSTLGETD